ncbi:MAG: hypothetical protein KKC28_08120 [Verrucomicrobia bacterium]|nr:hypothetical protein [Verrucomicrobiota bacterium]
MSTILSAVADRAKEEALATEEALPPSRGRSRLGVALRTSASSVEPRSMVGGTRRRSLADDRCQTGGEEGTGESGTDDGSVNRIVTMNLSAIVKDNMGGLGYAV